MRRRVVLAGNERPRPLGGGREPALPGPHRLDQPLLEILSEPAFSLRGLELNLITTFKRQYLACLVRRRDLAAEPLDNLTHHLNLLGV